MNRKVYLGLITDINLDDEEAEVALLFPPIPSTNFTFSEDLPSHVISLSDLVCRVTLQEKGNKFVLHSGYLKLIKQKANLM